MNFGLTTSVYVAMVCARARVWVVFVLWNSFSWDSPMPEWQKATVAGYITKASTNPLFPAASAFNATARAYPDVASYAGYCPVIEKGSPGGLMGTSESAPVFAGLVAMLNDQRLAKGLPPLGFLNPRLYTLAAQFPAELFRSDMDKGSSACDAGGYKPLINN